MKRVPDGVAANNRFTLNSCTAVELLREALPDVKNWMVWLMAPDPAESALRAFVGEGMKFEGKIGEWTWRRLESGMPNLHFWAGDVKRLTHGVCWVGLLEISGPNGERFHLFSYPNLDNTVGKEYLVSSSDLQLLRRFATDIMQALQVEPDERYFHIDVMGGPDITLDSREDEQIYLEHGLLDDVQQQVRVFLQGGELYRRLKAPHRRGFLFTGSPGNGKTMLIRHILRLAHREFKPVIKYLTIRSDMDADHVGMFFNNLSDKRPNILILEDLDSLTTETRITKAQLLAQLDGLDNKAGVLILATTNHPDRIDSALVHRPSRFDRVWRLALPCLGLRSQYLREAFPSLDRAVFRQIATQSEGWSFAYLKELRISASIAAAHEGAVEVTDSHVKKAFQLLSAQFKSGAKFHVEDRLAPASVGFIDPDTKDLDAVCF